MLDGGGSGRLNNISNNYTVVGYGASIFDDMLDGWGAGRFTNNIFIKYAVVGFIASIFNDMLDGRRAGIMLFMDSELVYLMICWMGEGLEGY